VGLSLVRTAWSSTPATTVEVEQTVRRVAAWVPQWARWLARCPVDPLMIQLGQMAVVALVRVDGAGRGSGGCSFGGICSGVRTNDAVVGAGVLKPKSMAALEKGLVDARAAAAGARAVAVADAGDAAGAGKGAVVGMVGTVGAAGASAGATTAGAVSGTGAWRDP
jgi:hypothetical protein